MCEQQTLMFTQAYCRQPSRRFSVFFGLCSGGAGTMEFQYHNCLFLCVSLKQQVKKKKKSTTKITKQNCFSFFLSKDVIYNHYTNREAAQRGGERNKVMFQRFSLQGPHTKLFFFSLQLLLETVLFAKNALAAKSHGPSKAKCLRWKQSVKTEKKGKIQYTNFCKNLLKKKE